MKNEEFKVLLYRAVARLPSSSGIVMWVLSNGKLQRILKKYGAGKPTIIIFGEPGNGKTSLTSAMLGNSNKIKFVYGLTEIKKAIKDSKRERKILLIDNYSAALSHSKQEANRRCLDHIIDRVSEDEESPLVIITGEPIIVEDVKKVVSMMERTLLIQMPKIDNDKELYNIRKFFSENQAEYLKLLENYGKWDERTPPDETDVSQALEEFRQRYCEKYENRQIGLLFCYFYAVNRFSEFLRVKYGEEVAMEEIEKNIQTLFDCEKSSGSIQPSYEVNVWNEFVQDGGINKVFLPSTSTCQLLVKFACDCDYNEQYQCHNCWEIDLLEKYNPMDLRLPEDSTAAILIEKPELIPYFPKHVECDSPLLMINNASLLGMLNTYLETYCRKNEISVRSLTPKKLTKELFTHNLCLFEYVGTKHNTYTFTMKDVNNKNVRVIFIKLTMEQYKILKSIADKNYMSNKMKIRNYGREEVKEMHDCLKYFVENVRSLIGEVGAPSKVLDAEN